MAGFRKFWFGQTPVGSYIWFHFSFCTIPFMISSTLSLFGDLFVFRQVHFAFGFRHRFLHSYFLGVLSLGVCSVLLGECLHVLCFFFLFLFSGMVGLIGFHVFLLRISADMFGKWCSDWVGFCFRFVLCLAQRGYFISCEYPSLSMAGLSFPYSLPLSVPSTILASKKNSRKLHYTW
jgi:hypothetical protein